MRADICTMESASKMSFKERIQGRAVASSHRRRGDLEPERILFTPPCLETFQNR